MAMHRQANTNCRASHTIDLPHEENFHPIQLPISRKPVENSSLPLYDSGDYCRRTGWNYSRGRLQEKTIHLIPVAVLISLFILWWFSHPVSLSEITVNGRITTVERLMDMAAPGDGNAAQHDHASDLAASSIFSLMDQLSILDVQNLKKVNVVPPENPTVYGVALQ